MLMVHLYFKIQLISLDFTPVVSLCTNSKCIYQPYSFADPRHILYKTKWIFCFVSNAFFLIAHVLSFIKIDYGTLKSSKMEDFMQTNNSSPY